MNKTIAILIPLFAFLFNQTQAQHPAKYAQDRLLAQLSPNPDVLVTENGTIQFNDPNASRMISDLGIGSVEKLVRRSTGTVDENEPILIQFPHDVAIESKASQIMNSGLFKIVEPDFIGSAGAVCNYTPNDDLFANLQWGLHNDGTFNSNSVADADIDMDNGWSITKGDSSIIVGILDSGTKLDHPEFAGRIWNNSAETLNGSDDDNNGYIDDLVGWDFANNDNDPTDDHGHGTNVSGIIGANGDNNLGYSGVDWHCKMINCKIIDSTGVGFYSWWVEGIYYMVDNGANVINMSVGGTSYSSTMNTAINYAYINNVPVVASMMNTNNGTRFYPAGYNRVISVGATDTDNHRANPFSWGGGSCYGNHIDLCGPGNYIYGLSAFSNTDYSTYWGGTSQSTPLVTGVISLIKSLNDTLSVDSITALLTGGAIDMVGDPLEDTPGFDIFHGHGLLNAYNTLLKANSGTDTHFACDSFLWVDGNTYTSSNNSATHIVLDALGCDSMVTLDLTIGNPVTSFTQSGSILTADQSGATYQWLSCPAMTPITGATGQSFLPPGNGDYALVVSANGCTDTSACQTVIVVGLDDDLRAGLRLSPNPNDGQFRVDLGQPYESVKLSITDLRGKQVLSRTYTDSQSMDLGFNGPAGVYLLVVETTDKRAVLRLVKR